MDEPVPVVAIPVVNDEQLLKKEESLGIDPSERNTEVLNNEINTVVPEQNAVDNETKQDDENPEESGITSMFSSMMKKSMSFSESFKASMYDRDNDDVEEGEVVMLSSFKKKKKKPGLNKGNSFAIMSFKGGQSFRETFQSFKNKSFRENVESIGKSFRDWGSMRIRPSGSGDGDDGEPLMEEPVDRVKQVIDASIKLYSSGKYVVENRDQIISDVYRTILPKKAVFYPVDFRVERCQEFFKINETHLEILYVQFQRYDMSGKNSINLEDYFGLMLKYPRSALTDSMMTLIDSGSDQVMSFGEYVECTCTFACFEQIDLLKYFFFILDAGKRYTIDKTETRHLITTMWGGEVSSNLLMALEYLESKDTGEGTFEFKHLVELNRKYPNCFYPIFHLQVRMIITSLGETMWANHKDYLISWRREKRRKELLLLQKKMREDASAAELIDDDIMKARMGYFKYYCMPW